MIGINPCYIVNIIVLLFIIFQRYLVTVQAMKLSARTVGIVFLSRTSVISLIIVETEPTRLLQFVVSKI